MSKKKATRKSGPKKNPINRKKVTNYKQEKQGLFTNPRFTFYLSKDGVVYVEKKEAK